MILSLKAFRVGQEIRNFFCEVADIESGFDVLSLVAAQGDVVLEAYITDENGRIDLPPEAFDGQSFRAPVRRLERQWKKILTKPIGKGSVHYIEVSSATQRLIATSQSRIDSTNLCIDRLRALQQRACDVMVDVHLQRKMVSRYQALIDIHEANRARTEDFLRRYQLTLKRLREQRI